MSDLQLLPPTDQVDGDIYIGLRKKFALVPEVAKISVPGQVLSAKQVDVQPMQP